MQSSRGVEFEFPMATATASVKIVKIIYETRSVDKK